MTKPISATAMPALTLLAALIMAAACSSDANVSDAIGKLVDERQSETIRLADATGFKWDEVYLFDPYAARQHVCATLSIEQERCERQVPFESQDDGDMSIAFMANGRLVHYARHSRANGDFTPVPAQQPISRDRAVFRKLREGEAQGGLARGRLVLE